MREIYLNKKLEKVWETMTKKIDIFMFEYEESNNYIQVEELGIPIDIIKLKKGISEVDFKNKCKIWYMNAVL